MISPWLQHPGLLPDIWDTWKAICSRFSSLVSTERYQTVYIYMNFLSDCISLILEGTVFLSIFSALLLWSRMSSYWRQHGYFKWEDLSLSGISGDQNMDPFLLWLTCHEGHVQILQVKLTCLCLNPYLLFLDNLLWYIFFYVYHLL